ncbi:hypothetical protein AB0M28_00555 [Streptomyces sp. NPDC051940]|uniref:bpX5 domain-containing protein n=1 Tax=Streptomyces sp. NPDC051940 TaxID=3155675 RepID=UPI00342CB652
MNAIPGAAPGPSAAPGTGPTAERPAAAAAFTPRLVPREPPLPATAVAAHGSAAVALADAVRRGLADGRTARLRAAAADGWLLVLSDDVGGADLPWADGVHWLAHEHGLYLPAHRRVEPHPALVARAAAARAPRGHTLIALLPGVLLCAAPPQRPVTERDLAALTATDGAPGPEGAAPGHGAPARQGPVRSAAPAPEGTDGSAAPAPVPPDTAQPALAPLESGEPTP